LVVIIVNIKSAYTLKRILTGLFPTRLLAFSLLLLFTWGCSTQKNTFVNRSYHTISAKYNGYFNARESFREGKRRLAEQHVDNYETTLSIFRYGTEQQARSVANYMDVAYQKASIVIRRHSMNIRGVEYNKWIDDSYFLIARSHFFKRDFNLAILTFEYIVRQYDTPLAYESKVWIAKSQLFQGRYDNARQMLELVARDIEQGLAGEDAIRMYNLVSADYHMRRGNPEQAIPYLGEAIRKTGARRERTRLTFIQGQLYQDAGDYTNAQNTYARVLRMNPDFDLAFQARIRMAMAYDPASGESAQIRNELTRMLRDDKNKAYRDQIYYALGQMSQRQGREEEAIDLFLQSTRASEGNNLQKGLSFYRLARIYYERPDYLRASIYYDSTTTFLPQSFDEYPEISRKRGMLSELARHIRVIAREDSLQHLAALTASERNAIVDGIIAELREKERIEREMERDRMRTMQSMAQTRHGTGGSRDAGWYFYNPSAIAFGRTEFASRFGERPLEDMWRISNRQTVDFGFDMDGEGYENGDPDAPPGSQFDRNVYLRNIPTTPEMMAESNQRIAQAFYNKGLIFRDRFQDHHHSAESFETLISRFPEFDNRLYVYYFLYNLHRSNGNPSRAENYKNRILADYPDSDFARILGDPNYAENLRQRQDRASRLYQASYQAFIDGRYGVVMDHASQADTMDLDQNLKSQFAYLKVLSLARQGKETEFRQELQQVVQQYQGTPVYQPANDLLASLGAHVALTPDQDEEDETAGAAARGETSSIFSFNADAVHFFVVVIDVRRVDARELRRYINDFNRENFSDRNFSMSNIFMDERNQLITMTNFVNKEQGMEYYRQIMASDGMNDFRQDAMKVFLISVDNYPVFYQEKNVEEYETFFQRRYLRN
jgi:tetratricopeptide (TPR) repeat protein